MPTPPKHEETVICHGDTTLYLRASYLNAEHKNDKSWMFASGKFDVELTISLAESKKLYRRLGLALKDAGETK